ncbi:MAG: 6,7-dimethyl-8-ribityllumazine synthase [Actinomycetota bacterium]|nr:6,7-dimethyl-8-ribityllumazine synthase [Actinomycetota bacterium]
MPENARGDGFAGDDPDLVRGEFRGEDLRVGIIVSRYNPDITERLLEGARRALVDGGVRRERVTVVSVPGAFEIPGAAKRMAAGGRVDAIICLGAVVRGETEHFTYVCKAVQEGVAQVSLEMGIPITFGVLTTANREQALERAGGQLGHKGYDAAHDAVEMANTYRLIG